jgi:hypothetical protein
MIHSVALDLADSFGSDLKLELWIGDGFDCLRRLPSRGRACRTLAQAALRAQSMRYWAPSNFWPRNGADGVFRVLWRQSTSPSASVGAPNDDLCAGANSLFQFLNDRLPFDHRGCQEALIANMFTSSAFPMSLSPGVDAGSCTRSPILPTWWPPHLIS